MTALGPLSTDMYLPSLPDISARLGASTSHTQLTLSVFLLGFAAGQIVYGPFSDRFGRRPPLLVGFALFILATPCAPSPRRSTCSSAVVSCRRWGPPGRSSWPRRRARLYDGPRAGRELARMGTIMGIVPAIAPTLGGILQAYYGWRASFVVTTAGAMALCAVVYLLLPETLKQRSDASLSPAGIARSFASLLPHRDFLVFVALSSFTYGGLFAFISGSSFVLQGIYGLGSIVYGLSFTFCVVGYIAGTIAGRRMVSTRGMDGTIGIGAACLAGAASSCWPRARADRLVPGDCHADGDLHLRRGPAHAAIDGIGHAALRGQGGRRLVLPGIGPDDSVAITGVIVGLTVPMGAAALPATMTVLGLAAFVVYRFKDRFAGSSP